MDLDSAMQDGGAATSQSATEDDSSVVRPVVSCSARVDFDESDPCYVFEIASGDADGSFAASLSNRRVKIYEYGNGGLSHVCEMVGHTGRITGVEYRNRSAVLYSCSEDGTVRGWDPRSGREVQRYGGPSERIKSLNSLSIRPNHLAAGGEGEIHFWDARVLKRVAKFDDTHAEEVTKVCFHPSFQHKFFSASEDGLLCVFDLSNGFDEENGFEAAQNLSAMEDFGFYNPNGSKLWCKTCDEGLMLWNWMAACAEGSEDGGVADLTVGDARVGVNEVSMGLIGQVDYIIGCHFDPTANLLYALGGTNQGSVGAFPVNTSPNASQNNAFARPAAVFDNGHSDIVRSLKISQNGGFTCISGGEDARICVWELGVRPEVEMSDVGPMKRKKDNERLRSRPY